jgi:hypothetical protein
MKLLRSHAHRHIHRTIRKHAPKSVKKAQKLSSFKYPKLLLLFFSIILSYYIFNYPIVQNLVKHLDSLSYLGIFIAGALITFGFSAPFSVGFLLTTQPGNIILASLIGGFGAMIADITIFKTIKNSFTNEFHELNKTHVIKKIEKIVEGNNHVIISHYLLYLFAGLLIALPVLPDEIGVSMLAGLTTINPKKLAVISFVLHSISIFIILYLSIVV